jgi:ketosteroid isomerase-like protein
MTLVEIANELVAGCREGRERENLKRLYAEDAVSVEAGAPPGMDRTTTGVAGILGKHEWWDSAFIVHSASAEGPFPHGDDRFAVIFEIDTESRADGTRNSMREVAVYHVRDGKIVREEFFYNT